MKFLQNTSTIILTTLSSAFLAACGGGQTTSEQAPNAAADTVLLGSLSSFSPTIKTNGSNNGNGTPGSLKNTTTTPTPTTVPLADVITDVTLQSTLANAAQTNVPVTFGHVFAPGHVVSGKSLVGRLPDGTALPLQVDVKATHPDGSIRHAIISVVIPTMAAGESRVLGLAKTVAPVAVAPVTPSALLADGFTASVNLTVGGQAYTASLDNLLKGTVTPWLAGSTANEWIFAAPLKTAAGVTHPHLSARFAVRSFGTAKKARVDVTIENDWAYEASPQNFTYDAQILVGGKVAYTQAALNHSHHSRWRKTFWWGDAPQVHIRHNTSYLIATKAVPNYDQSFVVSETLLSSFVPYLSGAAAQPMATGMATSYMPMTGGRIDIGLLPGWSAAYLLSMDKRAKDVMLLTADQGGSFPIHYRDKVTDAPISVLNYPYMTIMGRATDTKNPATGKLEAFPACATETACTSNNTPDMAHQPGLSYLPYLVTGDHFYLEELDFWAMYNSFSSNPNYRENIKGLFAPDQLRGQAWSLRTVAQAAYISPDSDPLKSTLNTILTNNLDWYNARYTNNANANKLGLIINGPGFDENGDGGTGYQPWQDDFFTQAVGHVAELGFSRAVPLLTWKSKFSIDRMVADGACWIDASIYILTVRNATTGPFFATMGEAYRASHTAEINALACNSTQMATAMGMAVGEMSGYSTSNAGFPSNMQPALAYSAGVGGSAGAAAWSKFMSRSVKPDYSMGPQFAILPR